MTKLGNFCCPFFWGNIKDCTELADLLQIYLSFIVGRKVSPVLFTAIHDQNIIWTDISRRNIGEYRSVSSWLDKYQLDGLNEAWKNFEQRARNESDFEVLNTVVHWYVESNINSGAVEGSIVMAQTALELLYNYQVVEERRMIIGKDSESLTAANKIRLLLSTVQYSNVNEYGECKALEDFSNTHDEIKDAVDSIVFIRNAIVHSQKSKREKLRDVEVTVRMEALRMSLFYIEMVLLNIFHYKGKVINRIKRKYTTIL